MSTSGVALTMRKGLRYRVVRVVLGILLVVVLLAGTVVGGISVYFSSVILQVIHYLPTYSLAVTAVGVDTVTLQRTAETQAPGVFEIDWPSGQAIVSPMTTSDASTVTRQLLHMTGPLSRGTLSYWTRRVYSGGLKESLGLSINEVQIKGQLGMMPAWFVPGKLATWVILVHGQGVTREESLRVFKPLAQLGLPLLAISYRNDRGSPASPDGFDHLGDTEWQDLEAATQYGLVHGAQHLVLYGWSKGATIVEAFLHRSANARSVQAVVLDAPILDVRATIAYQAQERAVPEIIARSAEVAASIRSGMNFDNLDQLHQRQMRIPMLLFHGTNDTTTPIAVSDAFAQAHPDFVTYKRVPNAEHTEAWNAEPQEYDRELARFLRMAGV